LLAIVAQAAGTEGKSKPAAKKSVAKKPAAKKSAAKKSASKKAASKTAAAASAAKPAAKKDGQKAGQQGKCGRHSGQEGCKEDGTEDDCGGQFSGQGFREVGEDVGQVSRRFCEGGSQDGLQNREQGSKEGVQQGFQCCKLGCFHCRRRGSRSPSSLGSDGGNGDQCGQDGSGFCQPGCGQGGQQHAAAGKVNVDHVDAGDGCCSYRPVADLGQRQGLTARILPESSLTVT
jgi:hypothetical protein